VAKQSARSLRSEAGVDVALNWKFGTVQFGPHIRGAWLHEFSDSARPMDAAFGPVGYAVQTRGSQRDSAIVSTGVDLALSPRALLYADYSVQNGGRTRILGEWRVGLVVSF
jgi:outer membrane autotransporter protein